MTGEGVQYNQFQVEPLEFPDARADPINYAALIAAAGYEERCVHVPRELLGRWREAWVYRYPNDDVPSSQTSRGFWEAMGSQKSWIEKDVPHLVHMIQEASEGQRAAARVRGERTMPETVRFALDISSMDRSVMASIIRAFMVAASPGLHLDVFYSHGEFDATLAGSEGTVLVNEALEHFAGWPTDPSAPLLAIIGAGFEGVLALAAIETLEPSKTIMVFPDGIDDRFDAEVAKRNASLVAALSDEPRHYRVDQPYRLYRDLRSTVSLRRADSRVVLVPLGPKVFALAALLVACEFEDVSVWRVSADRMRRIQNRSASGQIACLGVRFGGPS